MEIILIILTSTILSSCFFCIYHYAFNKGIKYAEEKANKELLEVNKANQKIIKEQIKFAKFNG